MAGLPRADATLPRYRRCGMRAPSSWERLRPRSLRPLPLSPRPPIRMSAGARQAAPAAARPDMPLHTNASETDIRDYVKVRKISGGTRGDTGRQCRDTFASLRKTCRKLGVSFWDYLRPTHLGRACAAPGRPHAPTRYMRAYHHFLRSYEISP